MDSNSNSNSFDMFNPKVEIELESDYSPSNNCQNENSQKKRFTWTPENTTKLIDLMEKECKELWDTKNPFNKDRPTRQARHEYLATVFGTTSEEINRKIHNLRTQFNNELRKIKRKAETGEGAVGSAWEYFDRLSFLLREPSSAVTAITDPLEFNEGVNIELAEFQVQEEDTFGVTARAFNLAQSISANDSKEKKNRPLRVAASAPPPLPLSAHPMMWAEEPLPRLRPGASSDECQIFGDFVASELRTLKSDELRKKLKRVIQKAILEVEEEEEDMNGKHGHYKY